MRVKCLSDYNQIKDERAGTENLAAERRVGAGKTHV